MDNVFEIWLAFLLVLTFFFPSDATYPGPRQSNLVAFWPLDSESGLSSVVGKAQTFISPGEPILQQNSYGPFNKTRSSYSVSKDQSAIGNTWIRIEDAFTISLFLYFDKSRNQTRGVVEHRLEAKTVSFCRFCVTFEPPGSLKLWSHGMLISEFHDVVPRNAWNFYAFTYNPTFKLLNLYYGINGERVKTISRINFAHILAAESRFILGQTSPSGQDTQYSLLVNDSVSCLTIYNVAITSFEIAQLPHICETKGLIQPKGTLPRPWALTAFWPLDSKSQVTDVAYNREPTYSRVQRIDKTLPGPFSTLNSCFVCGLKEDPPILNESPVNLTSAFTVSFCVYISSNSNGTRGLFSLWNGPSIRVTFREPNFIETWQQSVKISSYQIAKKGGWNFFAFVYYVGKGHRQLSVYYYEDGVLNVKSTTNGLHSNGTATVLYLGHVETSGIFNLLTGDALACFSIYNEALTSFEIAELPNVCKTKGKGNRHEALPRPESLAAFVPLDAMLSTREIAYDIQDIDAGSPKLAVDNAGPFGEVSSSYSVARDDTMIAGYGDIFIESSFTLSFYFQSSINDEQKVAIVSLVGWFSVTYSQPNILELWNGYADPILLASLPVLQNDTWAFFAFAYDGSKNVLDIYSGEDPNLISTIPDVDFHVFSGSLYAGTYQWSGKSGYMKMGDAISCLMVYSSRLTSCEINDLPRVCREKGNGTFASCPDATTLPSGFKALGHVSYNWKSESEKNSLRLRSGSQPSDGLAWPRPGFISGFWPLDANSQGFDIVYNRRSECAKNSIRIRADLPGPFGVFRTSASGARANNDTTAGDCIAMVSNIAVPVELTVSFYYRTTQGKESSILSFDKGLGLLYGLQNIEIVHKRGDEIVEIGRIPVAAVGRWMFMAVTYDKGKRQLKVFNDSAYNVETFDGVDIEVSNSAKFKIGYACRTSSSCEFIQESDALACVMVYSAALMPSEISQLPYVCQTNGRGFVSETAFDSEKSPQRYADILPFPSEFKFTRAMLHAFTYNSTDSTTFSNWMSVGGADVATGFLTRPQRSRVAGALEPIAGNLSKPDWRIEVEFGTREYVSGQRSTFGIILAPYSNIPEHLDMVTSSTDSPSMEAYEAYIYRSVPALVFGQFLSVDNNAGRQFIASSYTADALLNTKLDCGMHCAFSQADLIAGIKMVLQAVEGRLTVAMYSPLQRLAGTCLDNVNITDLSNVISNGSSPASLAVFGSNKLFVTGNAEHTIVLKELLAYEFTYKETKLVPTQSEINNDLMPLNLSSKKKAILLPEFSFSDIFSMARNWEHTISFSIDGTGNNEVALNAKEVAAKAVHFVTRNPLPAQAKDWRIELKLAANSEPLDGRYKWSVDFGIVQAGLDIFFDDKKNLVNSSGFCVPLLLTDPAVIGYRFSATPMLPMSVLATCDDRCSLNRSELAHGVSIAVQSIADQVSVSLLRTGWTSPTRCLTNLDVTGLAKLISDGKAKVALLLPPYSGTTGVKLKLTEFRFFSIDEAEIDNASTSQAPTSTSTAITSTTNMMTADITMVTSTTSTSTSMDTSTNMTSTKTSSLPITSNSDKPEPLTNRKVDASILDTFIPSMPPERTTPVKATSIVERCDDFASNRSVPPNNGEPTPIEFGFQVTSLLGVDNVNEAITIHGLMVMKWKVTTCHRNSTSAFTARHEKLYVPSAADVWVPKLRFASSSSSNYYMTGDSFSDDLTAIVTATQEFLNLEFFLIREGTFPSTCHLNLRKFPFDQQTCTFRFELVRPATVLQVVDPPIFEWYEGKTTSEWSLIDYRAGRTVVNFVGAAVHGVELNMTLSRLPDYYVSNLALPSGLIAFVAMATFLIPPELPDRPAFSVTTLLALIVAQSDVRKELPKIADGILLGDYITCMAFFSAGITVYEIVSIWYAVSLHGIRLAGGVFKKQISYVRFMDIIAFLLALSAFVGIHVHCFLIMRL